MTGATGTLGTALRRRLEATGREIRAASRSPPDRSDDTVEWVELDLTDGTGIESALAGVDVVIHAATAPRGDTEAVDVRGTERLLATAADTGVQNVVYPSIVGVDEIPFAYYEHKAEAETAIADSEVPSTIVRATQFHSFVAGLLDTVAKLPVWPLPRGIRLQPVGVDEVADAIAAYATSSAAGRVEPVGGPEVLSVGELARSYREERGLRRPIVQISFPGETAGGFRAGHALCPDHAVGTVSWGAWLAERDGE